MLKKNEEKIPPTVMVKINLTNQTYSVFFIRLDTPSILSPATEVLSTHHVPIVLRLSYGKKDELLLAGDIRVPAAVKACTLGLSQP